MTAQEYATQAHKSINQKRKYSGEDYIAHPSRVVEILKAAGESDQNILSAAWLHDVIEDVFPVKSEYSIEDIASKFGSIVAGYVQELTDEYVSSKFPKFNRKVRKKLEAERLSKISQGAMKCKIADLIDNTEDIARHDPGFAKAQYFPEKIRILAFFKPIVEHSSDLVLKKLFFQCEQQLNTIINGWVQTSLEPQNGKSINITI